MGKGARSIVGLAGGALIAWLYTWLAGEWSVGYFIGLAALIAVVGPAYAAFVELPKNAYPRLRRARR